MKEFLQCVEQSSNVLEKVFCSRCEIELQKTQFKRIFYFIRICRIKRKMTMMIDGQIFSVSTIYIKYPGVDRHPEISFLFYVCVIQILETFLSESTAQSIDIELSSIDCNLDSTTKISQ